CSRRGRRGARPPEGSRRADGRPDRISWLLRPFGVPGDVPGATHVRGAACMSSQVNGRPTGPGGTVKDREIAAEQRYVDRAYARLEEMRAEAQAMIREGYRQSLAGTKGSLVDRDAMVHQAALRAQALDVADDGLVFGRLDLASREVRHIGRIRVRSSEHDSLVIDRRAPAP